MIENFRQFEVGPDPFGRTYQVEYRWQQTAISIRHSDSVDVKFWLHSDGNTDEKVIALPHPLLLTLSKKTGTPLSDTWCMQLASYHLKYMIETDRDMDKVLVTASMEDLERAHAQLEEALAERR